MPKLFAGSFWLSAAPINYVASTGNFGGYLPSDRADSGSPDVIQYRKTVNGTAFDFSIIMPKSGGTAFTYGRFGKTVRQTDQEISTTYSVLGVPTQAGDIPVAPYPSYSRSAVIGDAFRLVGGRVTRYRIDASIGSLKIDPATGVLSTTLQLIGIDESGARVDLGTYVSNGTNVRSNYNAFSGTGFTFFGGFLGPQAIEAVYPFTITKEENGVRVFSVTGAAIFGR